MSNNHNWTITIDDGLVAYKYVIVGSGDTSIQDIANKIERHLDGSITSMKLVKDNITPPTNYPRKWIYQNNPSQFVEIVIVPSKHHVDFVKKEKPYQFRKQPSQHQTVEGSNLYQLVQPEETKHGWKY